MSLRPPIVLVILALLLPVIVASAQSDEEPQIQEFFTLIDVDNQLSYFDLFGMDEGTTLYVYAESYDIDTFIGICNIDCDSDFYAFSNDIDGRRDRNSAFSYTFEEDGDYSIFIRDCCNRDASGVIRVLIGLEAPQVLTGEPFPTGDPFAVIYQPTYIDLTEITYSADDPRSQQLYGRIDADSPVAFYSIGNVEAGQTLYAYVESNDFDTALGICDATCDDFLLIEDDISETNLNSSMSYTFEESGTYLLAVADCCDETQTGRFRLLLGFNAPEVAKNNFLPNGAQIAKEYDIARTIVQTDIDRNDEVINENCEDLDLNDRPELSGTPQTVETENFIIHYTTSGTDAAEDSYVQDVANFVELVYEIQVEEFGWAEPPRDCGEGGDTRYDFYLMDVLDSEDILGYADPEQLIGDNPASAIEEEWAAYGYMVIDNDYDGVTGPRVVMRATVAHEFHHLIQFGYDLADPAAWLYESTASWVETITSDKEDATGYTSAVFDEPHLCVGSMDDRSGLRIYGEWLLIDSIAQDHGLDSIIALWEIMADEEGMDAFYEFIDDLETTPENILRRYAIRNLLLDYALAERFPTTVDVEEIIEDTEVYENGRDGIEELGVQYVFIRDAGRYTFSIDNDDLSMVVVGINPDDNQVDVYPIGMEGTIDTDQYDYTYIIIMNLDEHSDPDDCDDEDWELTVSDGSNASLSESNNEVFDAFNFDPAD